MTLIGQIQSEFEAAQKTALKLTGECALLAETPWLSASINLRNPYIDPLNKIQIQLLSQLQSEHTDESDMELLNLIRERIDEIKSFLEG